MEGIPAGLSAALRRSRRTVLLTGAGVSAESGVPTFRDAQTSLWARYRPQDLATLAAFERDLDPVWQWYQWRCELISRASPNAAHLATAALERLIEQLTLITQNVDGLHQMAGSRGVIEFHGNIHRNRCSIDNQIVDVRSKTLTRPPRCPQCRGWIRPDVVWFGEPIPQAALAEATMAASDCNVFLSIGTSAVVYPAAALASMTRSNGAVLVEINPRDTPQTGTMNYRLRGTACDVLPAVLAALH